MNGNLAPVTGVVRSIHTYVNMCVTGSSPVRYKILDLDFKVILLIYTSKRDDGANLPSGTY